ncbi:MAG: hypothetical protein ACLTCP_08400 [Ruminococcus bicirculans (ex Wegman et al. 2014)]
MDGHVEWLFVIWGLLLSGIGAYEIYQTLITNKKAYRSAVKCANDAKEDTCEYCGNVYVIGTCHECPHCERRSDHITWKQNSLSQMLQKNKKGGNNKCHIHREEALTEEDHTEARITAAIRTEAQEEAHAT